MNWLRSVVAVGAGFVAMVVVYVIAGKSLGALIQPLMQRHQLGDDNVSPQGEMIFLTIAVVFMFIVLGLGSFVAALLAPNHRFRHGIAIGVVTLSMFALLWLASPTPLDRFSVLTSVGALAGCALGALAGQWLANRVAGGSVEPPRAASLDETQS